MRATLASPTLARYAGRFVWLELDFDNPANAAFLTRHEIMATPTLLVLDPADERATATQLGGLTVTELGRFLDRGARGVESAPMAPADASLARGDGLAGRGDPAAASAEYRKALALSGPDWPERPRAVESLTAALLCAGQPRDCAEAAAARAPGLPRGPEFAGAVRRGLMGANQGGTAPWADVARRILEPLAAEAIAVTDAQRDDRFELYQQLMHAAQLRGDKAAVARWGGRWLDEIDATAPASDDERSALDIARVDAAAEIGDPLRVIPALAESERAMPDNYNASLRLAQMDCQAARYADAVAASDRGLARVRGPLGRAWLLQVKAEALLGMGKAARARDVLEEALRSARAIGPEMPRRSNVRAITRSIERIDHPSG